MKWSKHRRRQRVWYDPKIEHFYRSARTASECGTGRTWTEKAEYLLEELHASHGRYKVTLGPAKDKETRKKERKKGYKKAQ